MEKLVKISLLILRVYLGWYFFYTGIFQVLTHEWTIQSNLMNTKNFAYFYQWLTSPAVLTILNFLNEWGLILLGFFLILGIFTRLTSLLGAVLMIFYFTLYYLPILQLNFMVDKPLVYALVLILFAGMQAGRYYGLDGIIYKNPICQKYNLDEKLGKILG